VDVAIALVPPESGSPPITWSSEAFGSSIATFVVAKARWT